MRKTQKKIKAQILSVVLSVFCIALSACTNSGESSQSSSQNNQISVSLVNDGSFETNDANLTIDRGENVQFTITMKAGYVFLGCNYESYDFVKNGNDVTITLYDVAYPVRIQLQTKSTAGEYRIAYHLNGGETSEGSESFFVQDALEYHLRPNVSIGEGIERPGHTLYGWNTQENGRGEHIGLGSRITLPENGEMTLYAEWVQWANIEDFEYESVDNGCILKKYIGDLEIETLVLPNEIQGDPVVEIATGFLQDVEAEELILPQNLYKINERAFENCQFDTVTLFDALTEVNNASFSNMPVKTLQINAARKPAYLGVSEFSQFADNIDRLMLAKGEKKMIFFAGCSMTYGLSSELILEEIEGYTLFNMGLLGGSDAGIQFDCITEYLETGDIFIHAPEQNSTFQFMGERKFDARIYAMLEGNYDLLRVSDLTAVKSVFDGLGDYNKARALMRETDYDAYKKIYNEYGDFIGEHPDQRVDEDLPPEEYTFSMDVLTEQALNALSAQYDRIRNKGAQVYFSFAPINRHGLPQEDIDAKVWETYETRCREYLEPKGYPVISKAEDYIFKGGYFFDADYHLGELGAQERTKKLIEDLKKVLGNDK